VQAVEEGGAVAAVARVHAATHAGQLVQQGLLAVGAVQQALLVLPLPLQLRPADVLI